MLRIFTVLIALLFSSSVWAHGSCHPSTHKTKQSLSTKLSTKSGPTLWVRSGATFTGLRQTKRNDTKLYVDKKWANGWTTDANGKQVRRYTQTCLATVYAMIEHARGNSGYRIGQPGTWVEPQGAAGFVGETGRGLPPSPQLFQREFNLGNPVILQGHSKKLGTGHFMLAVGLKANGDIVALDPLTGRTIDITNKGGNNWSVNLPGVNATYTIQSVRTIKM